MRQLGLDEMQAQLTEMQRGYFNLRLRHATKELENSATLRAERRAIAQVKTLIREKQIAAARS